jgi:O-antigen ligase
MRGRAGVLALAALAPAAALTVDPSGWYPFGPSKWLVISTLLLAGSALVVHQRGMGRVPRAVGAALVGLVGWLALAALLGQDRLYAFEGTPERRFGVLTWALCALALVVGTGLDADDDGRLLTAGLLVAGLGLGGVATAEALGWEPRLLDVADRLSGSYGSPAYLGAATALLLPVALAVALAPSSASAPIPPPGTSGGRRAARVLASVSAGLLVVACLGSGARAAWFGLGVAGLATALARRRALRAGLRRHRVASVAGGLGLVAVALAVVALTPVGGRLSSLDDPHAAGGRGRLDEWRVAARVVEDHPIVGVGPEGYRTAFDGVVDARYERTHGRRQHPDRAHAAPLDLAVAGGVPALVAWLGLVALVGRSVWRALRDGPLWQAGLAAALVAHVSGQLLLFPVVELEPVAWLLAGVLVGADHGRRETPARARLGAASRALAAGLAVAAGVALVSGATEVVADRRAERAADALARGDGPAAATAALDAARLRPDLVRLHLLAARALVVDQRGFTAGLAQVDDALRVSPRDPIALLTKASFLVGRAEATGTDEHRAAAAAEVRRQLADDPNDAALWRLVARVEALSGHPTAARRAQARAVALTPPAERP